jgi:hypothetical protein
MLTSYFNCEILFIHGKSVSYALKQQELRYCACGFTVRNDILHFYTHDIAGKYWYERLIQHQPQLYIRAPELTSTTRTGASNQKTVPNVCFFLGGGVGDFQLKHKFRPSPVLSADETDISTVPKKLSQIF